MPHVRRAIFSGASLPRPLKHLVRLASFVLLPIPDYRTDPHEWHNLAGDPEHVKVKQELRRELQKLTGRSPVRGSLD